MIAENQSGDIHINLTLGYEEVRDGSKHTLILPDGRQVTIPIPPDAKMGQEIRLAGMGNPAADGTIGTLVITLAIASNENFGPQPFGFTPTPDLMTAPAAGVPFPPPGGQPIASNQAAPTPYPPQSRPYASMPPLASATPPARTSRPSPRWLLPAAITLLVVLVVSSVWALYSFAYVPYRNTNLLHATSTARVYTARTRATATTLGQVRDDYTQITGSQPTLTDSLQAPDLNDWDTGDQCTFSNNAYHITAHPGESLLCVAHNTHFSNLAYQVHLTFVKSDNQGGGLLFRANGTTGASYGIIIAPDGRYHLSYYPAFNTTSHILDWQISPFINTDMNKDNTIMVIARGNTFQVYINGHYIDNVKDANLSTGQIGLVAQASKGSTDNTEIAFTQVQVWDLH